MNVIMKEIKANGDWYDPYGEAMGWLFAIAEVVYVEFGEIMPELRPSPLLDGRKDLYDREARHLLTMIDSSEVGLSDLEYAFKILDRYADWCRLAGRDY